MLYGLLILLIFQCIGEFIIYITNWPIPGPVIGILLMLMFLLITKRLPGQLEAASNTLIRYLSLLFLPASVGIFFLGEAFDSQWPAVIGVIVVSTLAALIFVTFLLRILLRGRQQ